MMVKVAVGVTTDIAEPSNPAEWSRKHRGRGRPSPIVAVAIFTKSFYEIRILVTTTTWMIHFRHE